MKYIVTVLICFGLLGFCGKQSLFAQSNNSSKEITTKSSGDSVIISGLLKDSKTNLPLPSVSISVNYPKNKIVGLSDYLGKFSVKVKRGAELLFSYVGYTNGSYNASKDNVSDVEISMVEKAAGGLSDVVVSSFRTTERATFTGASTIITAKDIKDQPANNVMELLQGRVAGLNIQNNNGTPGVMGTVQIRGLSTAAVSGSGNNAFLQPTSPLYVIDGVPIDVNTNYQYGFNSSAPGVNPLSLIPAEDVESIEVLKDAAATALWGSKGAYGVIIITTKRGNSQVPIVQYISNYTYNAVPKLRPVIGGREERDIRLAEIMNYDTAFYHGLANINTTPFLSDSLNSYYDNSTNWQAIYFRPTFSTTQNVSMMGGNDKFNYKINVGYQKSSGIIKGTGFDRYNIDMSTMYNPSEKFKMLVSINTGLGKTNYGSGNAFQQDNLSGVAQASSLLPPPNLYSPISAALGSLVQNDNKAGNISGNLDLEFEPVRNLRFITTSSYTINTNTSRNFTPSFLNGGSSIGRWYNDRNYTLYNRQSLNYNTVIKDKHSFLFFIFNELNSSSFRAATAEAYAFPNDNIQGPTGYQHYGAMQGVLDNLSEARSAAFGGDFSYNYDKKYVVEFQLREDATSQNGPSVGYTKNPTVSARWNFNKEKFMENLTWLDYGSLRFSYGKNIVPQGDIFDAYGKYNFGANFNGAQTVNVDFGYLPNHTFKPIQNTQLDFGYESSFLNGRLSLVYDYYYKMVDNQSFKLALPNSSGFTNINTNAVSQVNYGHEVTLSVRPLSEHSAFKWQLSFNITHNTNVLSALPDGLREYVIVLPDGAGGSVPILYRLGSNTFTNFLYNTKGVYTSNSQVPVDPITGLRQSIRGVPLMTGGPIFSDVNGDYKIDANDEQALGDPQPKYFGGFSSYLSWKQWSLSTNVSFTLDRDVINESQSYLFNQYASPYTQNALPPFNGLNVYTKNGQIGATYPNPYNFLYNAYYDPFRINQTLFMQDGSYVKINQITIAYTVIPKFSKRYGISSARFYLTGNNIATFSPYTGPNPENITDLGRDNPNTYPNSRNYTLGLNLQF